MTPEENFKESDESRSIIEDTPKDESLDNKDTRSLEVNAVEALESKSYKDYIWITILCFMIAFGGFVFGYDTGTISGFVNMTDFIDRFGQLNDNGERYLSNIRTGMIISIFNIGCCIGGLVFSKVGDIYGRRIGLMFSMVIYIIGIIVQFRHKPTGTRFALAVLLRDYLSVQFLSFLPCLFPNLHQKCCAVLWFVVSNCV